MAKAAVDNSGSKAPKGFVPAYNAFVQMVTDGVAPRFHATAWLEMVTRAVGRIAVENESLAEYTAELQAQIAQAERRAVAAETALDRTLSRAAPKIATRPVAAGRGKAAAKAPVRTLSPTRAVPKSVASGKRRGRKPMPRDANGSIIRQETSYVPASEAHSESFSIPEAI